MTDTFEAKCPICGAAVYHDKKTWKKCNCGSRVYFDRSLKKQYGNPVSRQFRDDPWEGSSGDYGSEDDDSTESTLEEFKE